jgi:hypothetical protein
VFNLRKIAKDGRRGYRQGCGKLHKDDHESQVSTSMEYCERRTSKPVTIEWRVIKEPNPQTKDYEYRVITKGWKLSPEYQKQRQMLSRICVYARTMEKLYTEKRKSVNKREWTPTTMKAINGLIKLRRFDTLNREQHLVTIDEETDALPKEQCLERTITPSETAIENEQRPVRPISGQRNRKHELYALWMEFAYSERHKEKWFERMPTLGKKRCICGKSRIGYPHWPPTSIEEATEQFELCQNDYNEHRRNLVIKWWGFFNDIANITPWKVSEPQQRYIDAERNTRESSQLVQHDRRQSGENELKDGDVRNTVRKY